GSSGSDRAGECLGPAPGGAGGDRLPRSRAPLEGPCAGVGSVGRGGPSPGAAQTGIRSPATDRRAAAPGGGDPPPFERARDDVRGDLPDARDAARRAVPPLAGAGLRRLRGRGPHGDRRSHPGVPGRALSIGRAGRLVGGAELGADQRAPRPGPPKPEPSASGGGPRGRGRVARSGVDACKLARRMSRDDRKERAEASAERESEDPLVQLEKKLRDGKPVDVQDVRRAWRGTHYPRAMIQVLAQRRRTDLAVRAASIAGIEIDPAEPTWREDLEALLFERFFGMPLNQMDALAAAIRRAIPDPSVYRAPPQGGKRASRASPSVSTGSSFPPRGSTRRALPFGSTARPKPIFPASASRGSICATARTSPARPTSPTTRTSC